MEVCLLWNTCKTLLEKEEFLIMEINFDNIINIDKKLYEKCILYYIYQHYNYKDFARLIEQDRWIINIDSVDSFDIDEYGDKTQEMSIGIPHGITGEYIVKCYILDNSNDLFTVQNMMVISHELAHMILKVHHHKKRTKQRHNDLYGKIGDKRNLFSSEVHDRVNEQNFRTVTVWKNRFRKFKFISVNILDLCNEL